MNRHRGSDFDSWLDEEKIYLQEINMTTLEKIGAALVKQKTILKEYKEQGEKMKAEALEMDKKFRERVEEINVELDALIAEVIANG